MNITMSKVCYTFIIGFLSLANLCFSQTEDQTDMEKKTNKTVNPQVLMKTSLGDIKIELYPDKAPITVKNFLEYVKEGFYDHTIFHRVIDGFMIQGGGFTADFVQKPTHASIKNEADNGLKNSKGTIAMARTADVNSATAQFFINVVDNTPLDFRGKTSRDYGYCVFGKVIEGMDVVDKIKKVKTTDKGPYANVPAETVEIISVTQTQ